MKTAVIIPARRASTRLPNKPLALIKGVPMIIRVWEAAVASGAGPVFVATDCAEIVGLVQSVGGNAIMTDSNLASGTDRVASAANMLEGFDAIINLQGDMPFINPSDILEVLNPLVYYDVGTLVYDMEELERSNPNSVKAIVSWHDNINIGQAHWFLRGPLTYGYHHAGIYSYHSTVLQEIAELTPSKHEQIEKLEQLRFLENGFTIGVAKVDKIEGEINTYDDLEKANL